MQSHESEGVGQKTWFYFPPASRKCTKPLWLFLCDYKKVIDLFLFLVRLADRADRSSVIAAQALVKYGSEEERERHQKIIDNPTAVFDKLKEFSYLNSKNLTVKIVDGFLWYLSTILQEAMKRRPQMVKSKEKIEIETIFDFKNRRELINFLIDRKINSLSYGSVSGLEEFIQTTLGVELFSDERARQLVQVFIEVRNIQIHNRGIVNRIFMKRVREQDEFKFKEGNVVYLDVDELITLSGICVETAVNLDEIISNKFGVQTRRISTRRKKTGN